MNKTPRLSPSGIEYLDYAWNFCSGCENSERGICSLGKDCWARKITERFKNRYPNGFEPTFYPEAFQSPLYLKKPSIIGVAFMGDLFGDWINYTDKNGTITPKNIVYPVVGRCPQHTFLFLTKCPWNLAKFSPFPDNCWVGVTATDGKMLHTALAFLNSVQAKVKYISLEPLLADPFSVPDFNWLVDKVDGTAEMFGVSGINWLIIGAQTKPYKPPKIEWVEEIVRAADKVGIPVFLKNNLKPLFLAQEALIKSRFGHYEGIKGEPLELKLRQEIPNP